MKMYRPHRLCPRNSKPKEPSLYRSLCVSILCMFLSTVMLVGTTMAWFNVSVQTGVFTITSANFSTTVYYCTELSTAEHTPNNWQRLNPGNTTLFGGGSLSSKVDQAGQDGQRSQVADLKLVNNSNIPLKYTFTLTASEENGNIKDLSLAGCQPTKNDGAEKDLSESALKTINLSAITPGSDSKTVVFDVPAATEGNTPAIVYAVLKLTCSSTNQTTYKFSLKLAITQTVNGAGETASNSLPTPNTEVTIETGSTPSTPVLTAPNVSDSSGEVAQQPNATEPPESGSAGTNGTSGTNGTNGTSGTSDTGGNDDTGGTGSTGGNGVNGVNGTNGGTGGNGELPADESTPTT